MRLICPNCSAQYEIDVTLIPDEGRDVQCSNCGHTWFELPPPAEDFAEGFPADEDTFADTAAPEDSDLEDDGTGSEDDEDQSQAAKAIAAATVDVDDDTDDFYGGEPEPSPPDEAPQPRRPADAASLDILREEADRELSQRRAPPVSEPIESQVDLGLDEIRDRKTPTRALRARMAHLNESEEPSPGVSEETDIGTRPGSQTDVVSDADYQAPQRDLLPDIDEINSTLKPTRKRADAAPEAVAQHRSGFRTGFLTMTFLAILMILAYAQAPAIARALPGSETAILTYVDKANSVRDWIDGLLGKPQ